MSVADLSIYMQSPKGLPEDLKSNSLGALVDVYREDFPEWQNANIALIGVCEERGAVNNQGCASGPDAVRPYLYKLFPPSGAPIKWCDLGNIQPGSEVKDTHFALKSVVSELLRHKVLPIIIGGSQDLTLANFSAYEPLEQTINVLGVDRIFDLGQDEGRLHAESYLNHIILHQPNFLFNYSNIGYQTYFLCETELELMNKLYFDTYRLGLFKGNVAATEPIVRNADLVSFDISAIRQSDAPGCGNSGPNGFYGEEACQMCRYAGMSDKLTSIGFYEFNPAYDNNGQTAHLLAQMIWCVIAGYYARKHDFPFKDEEKYYRYQVVVNDADHELVFFKSKVSDRWWLSVPYPPGSRARYERHHLVPCAYEDYQTACANEVPDIWWLTYQKIS